MNIAVSEIFGPTVQGEGPTLGRRCAFLRLIGCNLTCRWCDTPYTWDWLGLNGTAYDVKEQTTLLDDADVYARLADLDVDRLVVSGGEPLGQQNRLVNLFDHLYADGWDIEVETNGTVVPKREIIDTVERFNVSPKLDHADAGRGGRDPYQPEILEALQATGKAAFKFVAHNPSDVDELSVIVDRHALDPVFVMPEGRSIAEVARHTALIADAVIDHGYHLTTRLHVLTWGDERGR